MQRGFPSTSVPVSHFFYCRTPQDHAQLLEAWEEQPQPAGCVPARSATGKNRHSRKAEIPCCVPGLSPAPARTEHSSGRSYNVNAHTKPMIIPTGCNGPRIQGKTPFATQNPILQRRPFSLPEPKGAPPEDAPHKSTSIFPFVLYLSNSLLSFPLLPLSAALGSDTGDLIKLYGMWPQEERGGGLVLEEGKMDLLISL